jgi:hypothetical protein
MGHGHGGGVKAKAQRSADDIDAKGDKAKSTDPEAEVGVDAVDMGTVDPFQILSSLVLDLIEAHIPPVKHCLDAVTVNEGAARGQADMWNSEIPGKLMEQHGNMLSVAAGVAANWTSSGEDTAASAEFLARHVALQELIRAVSKACQGVGWLIGKATDLMVKVRDKIKQWVAELFAKIMERATMALATSWIPFVDVATTAEFVIESAIRIAAFIQEAYDLFQQVKSALNKAKQVLSDVKDGIDQIHEILGAMGIDVPALTTLSKGVEAISEPINKASDFADHVDDTIGQTADSVGEVAGAVGQIKGKKPSLKSPHGGHEDGAGGGSPPPWHQGGSKPQPGDSAWQHGPGGGYKGSAGAANPLPHVDGKPADPRQFAAMASQGRPERAADKGGARHGGSSTSAQGGAGAGNHADAGPHSGAGPQHHAGAGLSGGSHPGGAGAASAGTHSMGAAPVAEHQSSTPSGAQGVRDHGGSSGGSAAQSPGAAAHGAAAQGGPGAHGGQQHSGSSGPSSSGSGAGVGTGAPRDPSGSAGGGGRAPHLAPSGSTGHDPAKTAHTEAKPSGSSAASEHGNKPSHAETKPPTGSSAAGAHHDEKHVEQKHIESKPAGVHHEEKHAPAGHQHTTERHEPGHETGVQHHDNHHDQKHEDHKHGTGSHQTNEHQASVSHHGQDHAAQPWRDSEGKDSVHSKESHGAGWDRGHDKQDGVNDLRYGQPDPDHSHSGPYPTDNGHNSETLGLVRDHEAPYGRHPNGNPLTKNEYDVRYTHDHVDEQGEHKTYDNYPPNDGAVKGSRADYHDVRAYIRDYGSNLDRIGPENGKYLGVMPGGEPASFEQRSLPIRSLNEEYRRYEFTGNMPEGWKVQISQIAPGFAREGGGMQVLVLDEKSKPVSVERLRYEAGVLK